MKRGRTESGADRVDERGQWDDGRGSWGICVRAVGSTAGNAQWSLARVAGGDVLTKTTNMIRYAKDAPRVCKEPAVRARRCCHNRHSVAMILSAPRCALFTFLSSIFISLSPL